MFQAYNVIDWRAFQFSSNQVYPPSIVEDEGEDRRTEGSVQKPGKTKARSKTKPRKLTPQEKAQKRADKAKAYREQRELIQSSSKLRRARRKGLSSARLTQLSRIRALSEYQKITVALMNPSPLYTTENLVEDWEKNSTSEFVEWLGSTVQRRKNSVAEFDKVFTNASKQTPGGVGKPTRAVAKQLSKIQSRDITGPKAKATRKKKHVSSVVRQLDKHVKGIETSNLRSPVAAADHSTARYIGKAQSTTSSVSGKNVSSARRDWLFKSVAVSKRA